MPAPAPPTPGDISFLAPGTTKCAFAGMGILGPVGVVGQSGTVPNLVQYVPGVYSFAWLAGANYNFPHAWFHEIGHNYFLGHADTPQGQ